jgi:hypothetical protein
LPSFTLFNHIRKATETRDHASSSMHAYPWGSRIVHSCLF